MFSKILYPTDFSEVSLRAIPYIKSLRAAGAKEVIVLRVINENKVACISQGAVWVGQDVDHFLKLTYQRLMTEAYEQIKPVEAELQAAGFDVVVKIEKGYPYTRILEVADEENVSVIILGSHGRSNMSSVLLGSVSDHVIRHAKQPVIVIKRG